MGDDVCTPNLKRFDYIPEEFSEEEFCKCILSYFTSNLPRFEWHGFCNGEFIVKAVCSGDDKNYQVHIEMADSWREKLDMVRTIFFDHHNEEDFKFGIKQSQYYTKEKAEEVYKEYFGRR